MVTALALGYSLALPLLALETAVALPGLLLAVSLACVVWLRPSAGCPSNPRDQGDGHGRNGAECHALEA